MSLTLGGFAKPHIQNHLSKITDMDGGNIPLTVKDQIDTIDVLSDYLDLLSSLKPGDALRTELMAEILKFNDRMMEKIYGKKIKRKSKN